MTKKLFDILWNYMRVVKYGLKTKKIAHIFRIRYVWVDAISSISMTLPSAQTVLLLGRIYRLGIVTVFLDNFKAATAQLQVRKWIWIRLSLASEYGGIGDLDTHGIGN